MRRSRLVSLAAFLVVAMVGMRTARAGEPFVLFESGQVRPLALAPHRPLLYAVNTPDNRLEILSIVGKRVVARSSIPVGLEPVAVAARNDDEVWVVNHLSDSVSVVDVRDPDRPRVVRTLLVGDEPRDIVFAGPGGRRAFITTARRGQNSPIDPAQTTPGVGRANVWVFDAEHLGDAMGGTPLTILTLFADVPRALAVSPDGRTVYAAAFKSGNQTTVILNFAFDFGFLSFPRPGPHTDANGIPSPSVDVIAKFDGTHWRDPAGRDVSSVVMFNLPDRDVFAIDAMASPPVEKPSQVAAHVGTVLYNMAVNPVSGKVYVSNTDANNLTRFEGPGVFGGSTVRGNINENRITVIGPGSVTPRRLNKHIDYSTCCAPLPNAENARSLAIPQGMAISDDGRTLFLAAMGSDKIARIDTRELENDTHPQRLGDQLRVSGGGPTGLVFDDDRDLLFVATRFDDGISVIDTRRWRETDHHALFNPEPASVTTGRRFLYDAAFSSSRGDSSCATCHVDGDLDALGWDLGDPEQAVRPNNNPLTVDLVPPAAVPQTFHGMKGALTTQSLRGMANHGPMHWRGDRTGSHDEPSAQPDEGAYDEVEAFRQFDVAFPGLLGRHEMIPPLKMQQFGEFILQLMYPPNPLRNLDNSLTPQQQLGSDIFHDRVTDGVSTCNGCHVLDPAGNAGFPEVRFPGFFGTDGRSTRELGRTQIIKVPHLRNLYQKIGMFGQMPLPGVILPLPGHDGFLGDQVRGFGFLSAGDFDSIGRFMSVTGFADVPPGPLNPFPNPEGFANDAERLAMEQFLLVFDSNLAPIVGQQMTVRRLTEASALARVALMRARADADECDVVARVGRGEGARGYLYVGGGRYQAATDHLPPIPELLILVVAQLVGEPVTFTAVPPGSGVRIGLDRDNDGTLDRDDHAWPSSLLP